MTPRDFDTKSSAGQKKQDKNCINILPYGNGQRHRQNDRQTVELTEHSNGQEYKMLISRNYTWNGKHNISSIGWYILPQYLISFLIPTHSTHQ